MARKLPVLVTKDGAIIYIVSPCIIESFQPPSSEELNAVECEDHVRLIFVGAGKAEHLLVKVVNKTLGKWKGEISSLPGIMPVQRGDCFGFPPDYVYEVYD